MDWFLGASSLLFFLAGHPASALLLRCGLAASQRFSPRAALALSSLAALSGAFAGLASRGGLRAVHTSQRGITACAALIGGTLGRMLLLLFTARLPGSLSLARVQMLPLLALVLLSLIPGQARRLNISSSRTRLFLLSLLCAWTDGFFGAGGTTLFVLCASGNMRRRQTVPSSALLLTLVAQGSALLLTLLCGQAQVFPGRMLLLICTGSALGAWLSEHQKKRGALHSGMRAALRAYLVLAALACIEQAL